MTQDAVVNNEQMTRFEVRVDGEVAFLDYLEAPGQIRLVHTQVPKALEGRGVGSRLARAALEHAAERHLRVIPQCGFVRQYIQRHPEYENLVRSDPS